MMAFSFGSSILISFPIFRMRSLFLHGKTVDEYAGAAYFVFMEFSISYIRRLASPISPVSRTGASHDYWTAPVYKRESSGHASLKPSANDKETIWKDVKTFITWL